MQINYSNDLTLNLGDSKASHNVVVFANLGCPWCKRWYVNNWRRMTQAVQQHKLAIHLKFMNKPKAPLHNGNLANAFVDYRNPKAALLYVKRVYENQVKLDQFTNDRDVTDYLESHFNVAPKVSQKTQQTIVADGRRNGVLTVPTIFFDGIKHPDSGWNLPEM